MHSRTHARTRARTHAHTHARTRAHPPTHTHNSNSNFFFIVALRPRKRDDLLGTGTAWEGDDRVKARPRKPSEKDRRDRGPLPEQWKCSGGVPSPLPSDLCTAQLLFQLLCLGRVTKAMSVALLLTNSLDNWKQKRSNLLSFFLFFSFSG